MTRLVLKAHAKVNLDLRVLGRRQDGYHDLRTVFQTIALHDTVVIDATPRRSLSLVGDASLMPIDNENLAWKAAEALWRAMGRAGEPTGARITIRKRVPSQAGLGGGSSDAAATLVGLSRLWRSPLSPKALLAVAATLGADVPFFLIGGTALGLGRGDTIYPLIDLPPCHIVVVRPPFGVSTRDAYAWLSNARDRASSSGSAAAAGEPATSFGNDFEPVVEAHHPEIAEIRNRLRQLGARAARLSGSGSAVFGVFDTAARARQASTALGRSAWNVAQTTTVRRTPKQREFATIFALDAASAGASHLSGRRRIP